MSIIDKLLKLKILAFSKETYAMSDMIVALTFVADFNPSEYTLRCSNNYAVRPTQGTSKPKSTYGHGCNDSLSVSFLFDGTGVSTVWPGTVMLKVQLFLALMRYRGEDHNPPYLLVTWGDFAFQGVLKTATAKFTMFSRFGFPVRATIDAEFVQVVSDSERIDEDKKSSPDVNRVWRVHEGDRIDQVAFKSYGDVRYWEALAEVNNLQNPRRLRPGEVLHLPRLDG